MLTTGKLIKFQASDLRKDAGQTTIPLFDRREVLFDGGFPLRGKDIGLFHHDHEESAGYLAFKIFDFNMFLYLYFL